MLVLVVAEIRHSIFPDFLQCPHKRLRKVFIRTLRFIGGPIENGMQLTTAAPVPVQGNVERYSRVTLTARPDGTVLQRGEVSADRSEWTTTYAFIYRRRAE